MLSGKVVVIVGGAGMIGREFVSAVLENHGTAIVADVNKEMLEQVRTELLEEFEGADIAVMPMDISSHESIQHVITSLKKDYGHIDALVNSAYPRNKNYGRHFFEVEYCDFVENVSLNTGGYFLAAQEFARYFKEQGAGNIINIASVYGTVTPRFDIYDSTPMTMPVEYAVIKSGIIQLTKYMAKYLKGMNIRVNSLSPGGVLDRQPESFLRAYREYCLNKGMLDKSDLKGTLVYLLSDMSRHVNGQNIVVDDGFSL